MRATGSFDVTLTPVAQDELPGSTALGRLSIAKTFTGDLTGTSKGEMLSAITSVTGSAGYVALERVTGAINGRAGTFVLQHSGTMTRGEPHLIVSIVPDSATGDLTGLTGTMKIIITNGHHAYELDYSLADAGTQA